MSIKTEIQLAQDSTFVPPARLRTWIGRRLDEGARTGILSLIDQVVVSGTNFITTIVIGRACGADELGAYSLAFTLVVLITIMHQSLLMTPYTIHLQRIHGRQRQTYTGSVAAHHVLLSLLAVAGLALLALAYELGYGPRGLTSSLWVLTAVAPFVLLREFARRYLFAHLHLTAVLTLDGAVSAIQIAGLLALLAAGMLSSVSAWVLLGFSCLVVGSFWFYRVGRQEMILVRSQVLPQFGQNWLLGRWIFASQAIGLIHSYLTYWLLAFTHDTSATGVFSACFTVILLANPFIQGVGNVLSPWIARSYADANVAQMLRVIGKSTCLFASVMGLFFLFVLAWGGRLIELFFGAAYAGQQSTVSVLAAVAWVQALTIPMIHGLYAMHRSQGHFLANVIGLGVTLLSGVWLVGPLGMQGAAWALLAGTAATAGVLTLVFFRTLANVPEAEHSESRCNEVQLPEPDALTAS